MLAGGILRGALLVIRAYGDLNTCPVSMPLYRLYARLAGPERKSVCHSGHGL